MSASAYVETARPVESIIVGRRHRTDLGDLESLQRSIQRVGLLQPITVTPEGVLLCGLRRLEAVKRLGWHTVRCWVRSGLSDELGLLLAEQEENAERKPLAPLEAVELYRELKTVFAEEAARRKQAAAFQARDETNAEGPHDAHGANRGNFGPAESAGPYDQGEYSRRRAAKLVTGRAGYTRLEQLSTLQRIAADPRQMPAIRRMAAAELQQIQSGAPVQPAFDRVRRAIATSRADTDTASSARPEPAQLEHLAAQALERIKAEKSSGRKAARTTSPVPKRRTPRWFVLTWTELDGWTTRVDVDELAATLSDAECATFDRVLEETTRFAETFRAARARRRGAVA
jgi:ParB family chromosome partitioning protein